MLCFWVQGMVKKTIFNIECNMEMLIIFLKKKYIVDLFMILHIFVRNSLFKKAI